MPVAAGFYLGLTLGVASGELSSRLARVGASFRARGGERRRGNAGLDGRTREVAWSAIRLTNDLAARGMARAPEAGDALGSCMECRHRCVARARVPAPGPRAGGPHDRGHPVDYGRLGPSAPARNVARGRAGVVVRTQPTAAVRSSPARSRRRASSRSTSSSRSCAPMRSRSTRSSLVRVACTSPEAAAAAPRADRSRPAIGRLRLLRRGACDPLVSPTGNADRRRPRSVQGGITSARFSAVDAYCSRLR